MTPLDIELTELWQRLLYQHCFDPKTHQLSEAGTYTYLRSRSRWGMLTLSPLQNYFSTLCLPRTSLSQQQTNNLLHDMFDSRWHMATIGLADAETPFIAQTETYLAEQGLPFKRITQFSNWQLCWERSADDYMEQRPSSLKNTIKRKKKKLAKECDSWYIKLFEHMEQFEQGFADYCTIYQKSWKPHEEKIEFIRAFCFGAAKHGWLRLGVLYINKQPAAAQIWFHNQGVSKIFKLAYDPSFKHYSPGSLLTEWLMKRALEHDHASLVDFGMGNERYKQDWMNQQKTRISLVAFNHQTIFGTLARIRFDTLPRLKQRLTR